MPFSTTKTSNFLVTHYFYGGIVVCAYQRFFILCSCSLLFFHCCSFSPSRPLAFLIFSPPLSVLHVFFFQRNLSPFFKLLALTGFLCYPRLSVNIKNNVEKDPTLLLFFLSMAMAIFLPNQTPSYNKSPFLRLDL